MTEPAVTFIGTEAAAADLKRWADQLAADVNKAAAPLGARIVGIVRGKVPRLTGQLAGSVEATADDAGVELSIGAGLDYAGWIEFGGSHGRPYIPEGRYLYPSVEEASDEFQQTAASAADDSASRFQWSTPTP